MASFFDLVASLQTSIDALDKILAGGNTETVIVDGITKDTISKAIKDNFSALQAMMQGSLAFETKALMLVDTGQTKDTLARVWNDTTDGNNGLYGFDGTAWVQSPYDPSALSVHFNYGVGANEHRFWFDQASKRALSVGEKDALKGVFDVQMVNPDIAYRYKLQVVTKTETTTGYGTRFILARSDGQSLVRTLTTQYDGSAIDYNGINRLSFGGGAWCEEFVLVVDFSAWPDNTVVLNGGSLWLSSGNYKFTKKLSAMAYQLFRMGDDLSRATIQVADDVAYKKLVFGANTVGYINMTNSDDNYTAYLALPKNYEIAFNGNYQTIGIDLTAPAWVNNTQITELAIISFDVASLRKDFIPIASIWNVKDRVYVYPEFREFFELPDGDVLTSTQQIIVNNINSYTQIKSADDIYGQTNDLKANSNGGANVSTLDIYDGFQGKVTQLKPTVSDILVWVLDSSPDVRIPVSSLDLTKPLFLQLDYKVVSGGNMALSKYQQGYESGMGKSGSVTLYDNGRINRAVLEYSVAELADLAVGGNTFIVDYFSRVAGSAELVYNNLHYYQANEPVTNPTHSSELTTKNAQALNSISLTNYMVEQAFSGTGASGSTSEKSHNIVLSGSSITWGDGTLDGAFVGYVDEFFIKNKIANTINNNSSDLTYSGFIEKSAFNNAIQYKGSGTKITGVGAKVSFDLTSDEVAICHTALRTLDFGKMVVKADGIIIGSFDNYNHSLSGGKTENFIGDGNDIKFKLANPMTYNHSVTVGGVALSGVLLTTTYGVSAVPVEHDYIIIRQLDGNGDPTHAIWFKVAPANGASIVVNYSVGQVLGHTQSTTGQITGNDSQNEGLYGDSSVSFDPANPSSTSSGMEFRSINKEQYFIHKFQSRASRTITIEITEGSNPYFILDHVSTRFHHLMNAGIGGWSIGNLLNNDQVNDYPHLFKEFTPDVIINESSTNDDWSYSARKVTRQITGVSLAELRLMPVLELNNVSYQPASSDYNVVSNTGIISAVDKYSITSLDIIGTTVASGDLIRIGNYYGDNKQVVVREISSVDLATGKVNFLEPLNAKLILNIDSLLGLVGAEISVRDLTAYADRYRELINKIRVISPTTKIGITQPGLSNYFSRQLWGYENIHRKVASEFMNVFVVEVTDWLHEFQRNNISGSLEETIISSGFANYTLAETGHWQGFKVFVDGVDVYGKDCYIKSGGGYYVNQTTIGAANDFSGNYQKISYEYLPMQLVFIKNVPNGKTIKIQRADSTWSGDYAHTNSTGAVVYGQAYSDALSREL